MVFCIPQPKHRAVPVHMPSANSNLWGSSVLTQSELDSNRLAPPCELSFTAGCCWHFQASFQNGPLIGFMRNSRPAAATSLILEGHSKTGKTGHHERSRNPVLDQLPCQEVSALESLCARPRFRNHGARFVLCTSLYILAAHRNLEPRNVGASDCRSKAHALQDKVAHVFVVDMVVPPFCRGQLWRNLGSRPKSRGVACTKAWASLWPMCYS